MLTFEQSPFLGAANIITKLQVCHKPRSRLGESQKAGMIRHRRMNAVKKRSGKTNTNIPMQELPFQRIEHQVATVDAQPSNEQGGVLVVVSGALLVRLSP